MTAKFLTALSHMKPCTKEQIRAKMASLRQQRDAVKTLTDFIQTYELVSITVPDKRMRFLVIVEAIKADYLHILDDVLMWLLTHIEE